MHPPLHLLPFAVAILVLLGAIAVVLKARVGPPSVSQPDAYYLKTSLFSPAERSFLGVLDALQYEGIEVGAKIRLPDIFGVKKGLTRSNRQRAFNRISAKHVDFLLMQRSDGRPVLGIELDESSHAEEDRAARDSFVDSLFSTTGLPILHVTAKAAYDPKEVHRQIQAALGQS